MKTLLLSLFLAQNALASEGLEQVRALINAYVQHDASAPNAAIQKKIESKALALKINELGNLAMNQEKPDFSDFTAALKLVDESFHQEPELIEDLAAEILQSYELSFGYVRRRLESQYAQESGNKTVMAAMATLAMQTMLRRVPAGKLGMILALQRHFNRSAPAGINPHNVLFTLFMSKPIGEAASRVASSFGITSQNFPPHPAEILTLGMPLTGKLDFAAEGSQIAASLGVSLLSFAAVDAGLSAAARKVTPCFGPLAALSWSAKRNVPGMMNKLTRAATALPAFGARVGAFMLYSNYVGLFAEGLTEAGYKTLFADEHQRELLEEDVRDALAQLESEEKLYAAALRNKASENDLRKAREAVNVRARTFEEKAMILALSNEGLLPAEQLEDYEDYSVNLRAALNQGGLESPQVIAAMAEQNRKLEAKLSKAAQGEEAAFYADWSRLQASEYAYQAEEGVLTAVDAELASAKQDANSRALANWLRRMRPHLVAHMHAFKNQKAEAKRVLSFEDFALATRESAWNGFAQEWKKTKLPKHSALLRVATAARLSQAAERSGQTSRFRACVDQRTLAQEQVTLNRLEQRVNNTLCLMQGLVEKTWN